MFFCTDQNVSASYLLERYASHWSIEVAFRDLKQHLGFADSSACMSGAVQRTAPFVGLHYTLVMVWYAESGHGSRSNMWPCRPWYRTKVTRSFEDMLWAVRRAVTSEGVLDLAHLISNLRNLSRSPPDGLKAAA